MKDIMNSYERYDIISESLIDSLPETHPNIDQLIIKPYLFFYVPIEQAEAIQKAGIKSGNGIYAYFSRIPEIPKYAEYLKKNVPVKISIAKLIRSSDKVRVRGVNFPKYEDKELILKEPQLQQMAEKGDKFFEFFKNARTLEEVPKAKIEFQDGIIPAFTFKVLELKNDVHESFKMISEVLITRQVLALAEKALAELNVAKDMPNSKLPNSVKLVLRKTNKMRELRTLLPMAKRLTRILKIKKPEFIAAKAILHGILRSNDSKSELIALTEK